MILASLILVKRDECAEYRVLDKVSIACNFVIGFLVTPFIFIVVWASQMYMSIDSLAYQINLCIPAIGAFAIETSLCLCRKGYRKSGFFIQFICPAPFAVQLIVESIANAFL